jgi:asparagine synthase (glutamine-hydrolysing)
VSNDYDPAGIASFLTYGAPQDPLTIHRDIKSFPPGTAQWLSVDKGAGLREGPRRRYWRFPSAIPGRSAEEAASTLTTTLRTAVRDHLASDVPIAFFLSGGIDSAVIATLATECLGQVSTYSVGFESPTMASELPVARETANLLQSDHHEVIVGKKQIGPLWDAWMLAADRPSVDGLNTFLITKAVKAGNAKVAFSGLGADEIFGGYGNFFRVRKLAPEAVWQARFEQINHFERMLHENGVIIRKCFLHISRDEQRERLLGRLDDPHKNWKFRLEDLDDRSISFLFSSSTFPPGYPL